MAQNLWSLGSNTVLATLQESVSAAITLPVINRAVISLISGELPPGLRLEGNEIIGTPYEAIRDTEYRFVLRAAYIKTIEDRTFNIKILGQDDPYWITPQGDLAVGNNNTYYILDSSPIDFQLEADDDINLERFEGNLEYYIAEGDGELPPGTSLTSDGRIIGIVDPLLAIERGEIYASGFYDTSPYDLTSGGFDFGLRSSNGFDSFYYDTATWDFSYTERPPKKLNRYYEFVVSVTDGDSVSRRKFKIFVVGDDFFRADNTVLQVGTGTFTADNTNLRTPIWVTPSDLGIKRANNYVTIPLDIIDTNSQVGFVTYELLQTNPGTYRLKATGEIIYNGRYEISGELPHFIDSGRGPNTFVGSTPNPIIPDEWEVLTPETSSLLPQGIDVDTSTGDIAGRVPYQAKVIQEFKFTIKATRVTPDQVDETASSFKTFTLRILGEVDSQTSWITTSDLGTLASNAISVLRVEAETSVPNSRVLYSLSSGRLPPGLQLTFDGEIVGTVNAFGQNVYKSFWKPSRNYRSGDIVKYNGLLYLTLSDHLSSSIFEDDSILWNDFNYTKSGLTVFDNDKFILDGAETSIDREYKFTVNAEDQFKYNIAKREFVIKILDPEVTKFSNVSLKPFLKENVKQQFINFLSDPEVFIPEYIYRPGDPNFGIQKDIKIPVFFGVETKSIDEFVAASAKNHKRKKYTINGLKTAIAKYPGTNETVYEVVYLEIKDLNDATSGRTNKVIKLQTENKITSDIVSTTVKNQFYDYIEPPSFLIQTRTESKRVVLGEDFIVDTRVDGTIQLNWIEGINVDSRTESNLLSIVQGLANNYSFRPTYENVVKSDTDAIDVSLTKDNKRYISNLTNMRDNIRDIGTINRNFVPLWMRTPQEDSVNEIGYTPSIVLCYCKPGTSAILESAIKTSNFDFSKFNLDIDRYVIDSTDISSESKYIVFANYRFNI